ncbi:transmembrane emp24 domain-containing protein 1-like [Mizuhopecten yessoensis]|uniref:Transmembrane emp24 domain-containing protein 1 n=1 Tax=Mizuhopecten yessoensis TaxID=6573 RepID=A0A210QPQ5_MIZYE|nr:transmembrane emp24 domain-containing protein 1-like [Mizuhopecten yessoensis]OWF50717.1 Transmembrane emp24 domain-containing protein 1 [Mizuhopecten yessoensis]
MENFIYVLYPLVFLVALVSPFEIDLTVEVNAGTQDCFYQTVKKPVGIEIEYQVIDGGDLDVSFYVQAPDGRVMVSDVQKSDAVHKIDAEVAGDYKMCFDNTFSHFNTKVIYFELVSDDDEDDGDDDKDWNFAKEELSGLIDMTIQDFKQKMETMKDHLDKSAQIQHFLKNYEARDRNTQENNFQRVNWLSGIQVFVMVSVGLTQVLLIRGLFDDKSRVHNVMKART